MKKRASGILKLIAAVRAMAKSKALALKSRTNAMKARLVIFSLVMNKRYVMSTISDKFQSLLGHHHHHSRVKEVQDVVDSVENKCTVVVNDSAHLSEVVSDVVPGETHVVVEDKNDYDYDDDGECECYNDDDDGDEDDDDDGNKYPDLTHTMFESEDSDSDIGGSVIEMVKSSKEEAGQEFKMEDEIDHMADLFIRKFRKQILLQKQDSLNRNNEMQKVLES